MRGPRTVVPAQPAAPPRVGLIASARLPENDRALERWTLGLEWEPEQCAGAGSRHPDDTSTKDIGVNRGAIEFDPFIVWAGEKCSTFDLGRDWEGRVRRQLLACESEQIAAELWRGEIAKAQPDSPNRWLADPDSDVVTAGAAAVKDAVAVVEQALGACGCGARAMIHSTRAVASLLSHEGGLRREGALLVTALDTIVVADSGYDGSGPNGEPAVAGSQWIYGTGLVDVRRGAIDVIGGPNAEGIDRSTNEVEIRAERFAAATWDGCCHVAAEVNAPMAFIGS